MATILRKQPVLQLTAVWATALVLASTLLLLAPVSADDLHDEVGAETILRIASSSYDSGFHQSATTLAGLFNWRFLVNDEYPGDNHPMAVPVASPGSLTNIGDLLNGRIEMAFVRADIADKAFTDPSSLSLGDDVRHLRFITTHKPAVLHVVVHNDFAGTEFADLSKHTISVGAGEQTLSGLQPLLQIHGAPLSELKLVHAPIGESLRRLETGQLTAVMFFDQAPSNIIADRLANGKFKLITLDERKIEQFAKLSATEKIKSVQASDFYSNTDGVTTLQLGSYLLSQRQVSTSTIEAILDVLNASTASMATDPMLDLAFAPNIVGADITPIPLHPASEQLLNLYTSPLSERRAPAAGIPFTQPSSVDESAPLNTAQGTENL